MFRDVKAAQDAYRDTEGRLKKQEDEAGFLRRICGNQTVLENSTREELIQIHTRRPGPCTALTSVWRITGKRLSV